MEEKPKKKRGVQFDAEAVAGAPEVEEMDAVRKVDKKSRQTTLAKVRQTIIDAAEDVGEAVSDASSFTFANTVERVVVAIYKQGIKDWVGPEGLTLPEGFCLIWLGKDGGCEGRKTSAVLQAICYACMLAELVKLEKIDLQRINKEMAGVKWDKYVVHPTEVEPPDSYLEEPFIEIKESHDKKQRRTVAKWLEHTATSLSGGQFMVDLVLETLVDEEICKEVTKKIAGLIPTKRYPIVNNKDGPKAALIGRLRGILLDGEDTDPYCTYLLRLLRLADKDFLLRNPFMGKVLRSRIEWEKAKSRLRAFDELEFEVPEKVDKDSAK